MKLMELTSMYDGSIISVNPLNVSHIKPSRLGCIIQLNYMGSQGAVQIEVKESQSDVSIKWQQAMSHK